MSETILANELNNPNGLSFNDEGEISTLGELYFFHYRDGVLSVSTHRGK